MLISLKKIPSEYYGEYTAQQLRFFRERLKLLCLVVVAIFYVTLCATIMAGIWHWGRTHYVSVIVLTFSAVFVLIASSKTVDFQGVRLIGFLFASTCLFVLVYVPSTDVRAFNFGQFILSLFFICLLLPWTLRDVLALIFLHFSAWFFYYMSRDLSGMVFPQTIFGSNPFINGSAHLLCSAAICVVVRFRERQREIENFLLLKDLEMRQKSMEHEIHLAARLQQTLVPKSLTTKRADIAVTYRLAGALSGDYARFYFQDKDTLIFFIGDVTGHGVPAALLVNRLHVEFLDLVQEETSPGRILMRLNEFILKDFEGTSMYLSAVCGALDFKRKRMIYSNHGHPPQYLVRKRSEISRLEPQASLLGVNPGNGLLYEKEIPVNRGDFILLFTDGVLELRNTTGQMFGKERAEGFLIRHGDMTPSDFNTLLIQELESFSGHQFKDDVLLLSIRIN